MITLELLRVIRDGQPVEAELAARVRADGSDITIEGPEPELVDRTQPVLNLRDGTTITCTNPLPDVDVEPASVRESDLR